LTKLLEVPSAPVLRRQRGNLERVSVEPAIKPCTLCLCPYTSGGVGVGIKSREVETLDFRLLLCVASCAELWSELWIFDFRRAAAPVRQFGWNSRFPTFHMDATQNIPGNPEESSGVVRHLQKPLENHKNLKNHP